MQIDKWSVLAGLRCILAFIVAVNHLPDYVQIFTWALIPKFGAFEAILGFLLISGYSIGSSYQKEPEGFLKRRLTRIYPIYAASLILVVVVAYMETSILPSVWLIVVNALFLNQIFTQGSFVGPAWSLALEFWLYCLTPFLFKLRPQTLRGLTYVSFLAFLGYTCGRTLFHWNYYAGVGFGLNLILLSFIWLAGLRLARDTQEAHLVLKDITIMFAVHIALTWCIQMASSIKRGTLDELLSNGLDDIFLQSFTLMAVFWTFKRVVFFTGSKAQGSATLRLLGDISYPLYLVHIPTFVVLKHLGIISPAWYMASAAGVSSLLYWVLDLYSQRRHLKAGGHSLRPCSPGAP